VHNKKKLLLRKILY